MADTWSERAGSVDLTTIDCGNGGRLDIDDYSGSPTFSPVGALEGNATITFQRTELTVKAGLPQGVIQGFGIEDGATMKVQLLENDPALVGQILGYENTYYTTGTTPLTKKWTFGGITSMRKYTVQFTHVMPDGKYQIFYLYKAMIKPVYNKQCNAAGVNTIDLEITGMVDDTRAFGDEVGYILTTDTAPWP